MSDTAKFLLIFLLVLSPLYIPIAVTIVAFIGEHRETIRTRLRSTAATTHTIVARDEPQPLPGTRYPSPLTPQAHFDPPLTANDPEAA